LGLAPLGLPQGSPGRPWRLKARWVPIESSMRLE
jgi:hypothetical protein